MATEDINSSPFVKRELLNMINCVVSGLKPAEDFRFPDADNFCVWLATLLRVAGAKTRFVAVSQSQKKEFHHVMVEVWNPEYKKWFPLDPWQAKRDWPRMDLSSEINP